MCASGMVFDIARFSLNDGPGIRTVVFLKGCPLRCLWCHNPESQNPRSEILYDPEKCSACGRCAEICPQSCHEFGEPGRGEQSHRIRRADCAGCGLCAERCPGGALSLAGKIMSSTAVLEEVRKDLDYYRPEGGLTLSGGEPLFQADFSRELLEGAQKEQIHCAVESCGFAPWKLIESMIPLVDLWLYDIKCIDPEKHALLTGQSNRIILENLRKLDASGAGIELRCPLIPGKNDSDAELKDILRFAGTLRNLTGIRPEPYHPFGEDKLLRLGRERIRQSIPEEKDLARYRRFFPEWAGKA